MTVLRRWEGAGVNHAIRMAMLGLFCSLLSSCAQRDGTMTDPTAEGRTLLVCGVDRSGSIRLREEALERCGELLESVPRGRATVRWISGSSYRAEETILDTELAAPTPCTNPYAPRCRAIQHAQLRADRATRDSALTVLRAASAPPAQSTDILGYIAAAADWIHAAGPADRKVIALATDLIDTAGRRIDGVDVRNVEFLVFQQADEEPSRAYQHRAWFERLVVSAGAEPPRIIPLSMRAYP